MELTPTRLCRCLADELRMALVCLIHARGEVCVCELTEALQAPQSTISRHLAQLRECGVVAARRDGTWMHYHLATDLPAWAIHSLETLVAVAAEDLNLEPLAKAC